jgi:hypothetical protein
MLASCALLLFVTAAPTQAPQPTSPPPKPFDCTAPQHREFDFWVGEWDVVPNPETRPANAPAPPPGRKPASNVVEKAHRGCVLIENWDDRQGGTGQSFNLYDRVRQQWHQTWVDSNGGLHEYWGGLKDGNMVFIGQVPLPAASRFAGRRIVRLTFYHLGPDKVRQFSESLSPDGTWNASYDLIYTRRAKTK